MGTVPRVVGGALGVAVLLSGPAGGGERVGYYAVTDLGTLGGPTAAALDISDTGHIVGWSQADTGERQGFYLDQIGGHMTRLVSIYTFTAEALATCDWDEQSCGWGLSASGHRRAVVWIMDLIIEYGTFGGDESQACDLNNLGDVVGWAENAAGARRGLWDYGTGWADLGTLGGPSSEAHAVNDLRQIAGFAALDELTIHACRWEGAEITDLGTLGGTNSFAEGINALGQIVGRSEIDRGDPAVRHAFLWTPAAVSGRGDEMRDLGTLPGSTGSRAWSLNADSLVVGETTTADGELFRAFAWDASSGMVDLNDRVVDADGWVLQSAASINAAGVIVGAGRHDGVQRAFALTPVCFGDLDGDWDVDLADLAQLLAHYGLTGGAAYEDGDLDDDEDVDLADLAALLSVYGAGGG